jgi:hypothetical protein
MELTSTLSSDQSATSTNMASSNSHQAAHAVFGTNELLCDIIGRLPLKEIVIITGVCKTWRKALLDNVSIQQTLFLAPAAIHDITSEVDCLSMSLEDIPCDQYTIFAEFHSKIKQRWNCEKPNAIDPMFYSYKSRQDLLGVWQNTFITQPPSKSVLITISRNGCRPRRRRRRRARANQWPDEPQELEFTREAGVKLGELHAFCLSEIRKHTNPISLNITFVPKGVTASGDVVAGGRWEVRKGQVVRQTQPRLVELSDDSSDMDDSDDIDDSSDMGDSSDMDDSDDSDDSDGYEEWRGTRFYRSCRRPRLP